MFPLPHSLPIRLLLLLAAVGLHPVARAQLFSGAGSRTTNPMSSDQRIISDTSQKKQITTDDKIRIRSFTLSDTTRQLTDTSIHALHRNPLVGLWDIDLGNTGTSVQSLLFNPNLNPGMKLGPDSHLPYLTRPEQLRFYNTTRPYTDLYYRIGSKQEQILSLMHTQNITPGWNVSASYGKTGAPGSYKLQRTNHDHASLTTHYLSTNQRYELKGALMYNKFQQDENKGITDERYLSDAAYNDKRLVPVFAVNGSAGSNRSATSNYFRNASFLLDHRYFLGKADSVLSEDSSSSSYRFQAVAGIRHRLYADFAYYRFRDEAPDSLYNELALNPYDSVQLKYFLNRIGNTISLNGDLRVRGKLLQSEAGYGLELERALNGSYRNRFVNNFIFANINKRADTTGEWLYHASLTFYFTGNAIGNTLLSAMAGRKLKGSGGEISTGFDFSLQSPTYQQTHYESNSFAIDQNLNKQSITKLFVRYRNSAYRALLEFNYYTLTQVIYFPNATLQAAQYDAIFPVFQLHLQKEIQVRRFFLSNDFLLQHITDNPAIQLPLIAGRHSLSYRNMILKKKLQVATGLDLRYNMSYRADQYNPYLFGFAAPGTQVISNVPQVSYFFNFKVKRFRASVSLDELQQFVARNNINYPGYAAQNFIMRFGFHWVFIN